ncbi:Gamma-aminobutyric acid receptor subunit beta [Trichinella spiralis]|uniref:Gamma-aminobutyric acid receptor subunit beta n=1 Tax=Trichinella spiralis TaxID=6334 RepID=A0ABR3KE29_TRISP
MNITVGCYHEQFRKFLHLGNVSNCYTSSEIHGVSELSRNITHILNILVNKTYYDKRLRPNYGGRTVDVGITMHVSSISAVSEVEMDYTLDFYLRQNWMDPRLNIKRLGAKEELTVGWEYTKDIWVPDTFFPNEKKSYMHTATTHNSFLRIKGSGEVLTSQRLTVTASCPMLLHLFPLDSQECTLEIESYGYSDADIRLFWLKGFQSVTFDAEIRKLPTFELQDLFIVERKITLSTGDYSRLTCHLTFSRNLSFYWVQIYQPALMVVMISWVSFWISRESAPARVTLGIMTVLTMTTLMTTTNGQLPKTKERNRKKLKTLLQKSHKKTLKCSTSCQLNTTEELPCECDKLTSTTSLNASTWMHPVDPFAIPQSTTTIPKYPRFQRHSLNSFKKLSTKKFRNHHCCSSSDIDKYHSGRL